MAKRAAARKPARRTPAGGVTAAARKAHGSSKASPNRTGSFPIFDRKSAISAVKLRGHAASRTEVLNRAAAYAARSGDATVKAAVKAARAVDKG